MLHTERLELIPLTAEQINLWVNDLPALERELGCVFRGEQAEGSLLAAIESRLEGIQQDPEHWDFHTFWVLCRREDRTIIGELVLKGPPDSRGQVEMGYGVSEEFRGTGYATEAARAMCEWLLAQPGIETVAAGTTCDNTASARVLEKCGMKRLDWMEGTIWYQRHWRDLGPDSTGRRV